MTKIGTEDGNYLAKIFLEMFRVRPQSDGEGETPGAPRAPHEQFGAPPQDGIMQLIFSSAEGAGSKLGPEAFSAFSAAGG